MVAIPPKNDPTENLFLSAAGNYVNTICGNKKNIIINTNNRNK